MTSAATTTSAAELGRLIELVQATPLAYGLSEDEVSEFAKCLAPVSFGAGQTIVAEGAVADRWYVIAEGTASVTHLDLVGQPVTLAVLGPGDSFGERALLQEHLPRTATVTALTDLEAFALNSADFEQRLRGTPSLGAVLERRLDAMAVDTALKRASPFASLPHTALQTLATQLASRRAAAGEVIIREGEPGDSMFLVRSGAVEVSKKKRRIAVLRAGDSFGEVALLTDKPRTATVRALEDTALLALSRETFVEIASEHLEVAAYFRELIGARFRGAINQPLLLPDPISTIMPQLGVRRRKRYWLVLLVGLLVFGLLSVVASLSGSETAAYAVAVVGSLIGPVVFVQYLAESNILSERPFELLTAGVLGAALGLPPAYWLQHESGLLPGSFVAALLIAAIEEPAKLLGVIWLLRTPALRFRMDGVIFGAAAGMGFAALESMLYGFARVETANVGVLLGVVWFRALLSPFTHGTWTAIVCATIWRWRSAGLRDGFGPIAAALAAVILLHGFWDWSGFPVPLNFGWLLLVGAVSILTLRMILHRAAEEEAASVAALAPEVSRARSGMAPLQCPSCGRLTAPGARYCPRCGRALYRQRAS